MLMRLHASHQGLVLMKARARKSIFWPGITSNITQFHRECGLCENFQNRVPKAPLIPQMIPNRPWVKVALDYFELRNNKYIQLIDYYSKYIEVVRTPNLTAQEVIPMVKSIFARHGIPEILVTDGGPPNNSKEFGFFMKEWQIKHILTSPEHPQSNGAVERSIQTVKKIYQKAIHDSKDPLMSLLILRTTPVQGTQWTPGELLMGRSLRTLIPTVTTGQMSKWDHKNYMEEVQRRQTEMVQRETPRSREPKAINEGDRIKYKSKDDQWRPGRISKIRDEPRSYVIQTDHDTQVARNRKDVRNSSKNDTSVDQEIFTSDPDVFDDKIVTSSKQLKTLRPAVIQQVSPKCSRSGRRVVLPGRFKDFVM